MVLHPCPDCKGSGAKQLACPWGGCNGTGPSGGSCYRCGTLVDFPYSRRDYGRVADPSERVLVPYRLPDGRIVQVDDSAAKGAAIIDFTLAGGQIVDAVRVAG